MKRDAFRRHSAKLATLGLFAAFGLLFVIRIEEPLGPDQGLFATFGHWIPRGALPYRDIFDSKPPLFLYWFGLLSFIPGHTAQRLWCLEGIWLALTLVFVAVHVARLWGRAAGLAAATLVFTGMWAPGLGGYWARVQAEEILALPMLLSAVHAYRAKHSLLSAFLAGVFGGICGLLKLPALCILAAWLVWCALQSRHFDLLKRCALLVFGASLPWLLTLLWFVLHGEAGRFLHNTWVYPLAYRGLIPTGWLTILGEFSHTVLSVLALHVFAASVGFVFLYRRQRSACLWLSLWLITCMLAVLAQRQLAGYHFLLLIPPLSIAGSYAVVVAKEVLANSHWRRASSATAIVAACIIFVWTTREWYEAYSQGAAHVLGQLSRASYLRRLQNGRFSALAEEAIAKTIRQHTRATDTILVWGFSPGIYALSERMPATRFVFHKALLSDGPLSRSVPGLSRRRSELIANLETRAPAYIVVAENDGNAFDPEPSNRSIERFPGLLNIVAARYSLQMRRANFALYRLADAETAGR